MSYPFTYHLQSEPRFRDGNRSGDFRPKQQVWSFSAILIIALMILPMDYLAEAHCPIMEDDCCQMEASGSCHLSDEEENKAADPESSESCEGKQTSGSHEDCLSGMDCGCYFTPNTANNQNSSREATLSDLSTGLQTSGSMASFITHYSSEREKPVSSPLPRPVPLYLINQVFLN